MTGYSQEPPPFIKEIQDIQILRKPFNLEKLCALATEMTAA